MQKPQSTSGTAFMLGVIALLVIGIVYVNGNRRPRVQVRTPHEKAILDASNKTGVDIDTVRRVYNR